MDELTDVASRIYAIALGVKELVKDKRTLAPDDQLAKNALASAETFLTERRKRPDDVHIPRPIDNRPDSDHTRDVKLTLEELNRKD
jgi:hypothetical protein